MITSKQMKGMPTRELVKCDGCNGYHSLDEVEVVIIRMVKGKNCDISSADTLKRNDNIESDNVRTEPPIVIPTVEVPKPNVKLDSDGIGYHIPPKEMEDIVKKRKNIIPSGLSSMMIPPSDPNHESKGANEIRQY